MRLSFTLSYCSFEHLKSAAKEESSEFAKSLMKSLKIRFSDNQPGETSGMAMFADAKFKSLMYKNEPAKDMWPIGKAAKELSSLDRVKTATSTEVVLQEPQHPSATISLWHSSDLL